MAPLRSIGYLAHAALLAGGLSACSPPAEDEATKTPTGARCVVADREGELILHPGSLTAGAQELGLEGVKLDDATNLEVVEAVTVAFAGRSTVSGIVLDYPPLKKAGLADSLADWGSREPLAGRALTAADGQQAVMVAVRLTEPTEAGSLTGVTLSYTEGDEETSRHWSQPVLAKPPGEPCTVDDFATTSD